MDTAGSFDSQSPINEERIIFSIAALISSMFIFNDFRDISEKILVKLQTCSQYFTFFDNAKIKHLSFLIRDWQACDDFEYGYYDFKHSIGGKNFLTSKFLSNDQYSKEVKGMYDKIRQLANDLSCCLMPYPGKKLACESIFKRGMIEEDFVENLVKFMVKMFEENGVIFNKSSTHGLMKGNELLEKLHTWEKRLNDSTETGALNKEMYIKNCKFEAIQQFKIKKRRFLDNEKKRVFDELKKIKEEVVDKFNKDIGQGSPMAAIYRTELEKKIDNEILDGWWFNKFCSIL
jgi:hypothetical protein